MSSAAAAAAAEAANIAAAATSTAAVTRRQRIANALEPAVSEPASADDRALVVSRGGGGTRTRRRRSSGRSGLRRRDDDDNGGEETDAFLRLAAAADDRGNNNNDDDDDDDDDGDDDYHRTRSGRRRKRAAPKARIEELKLPGATARREPLPVREPQRVGEVDERIVLKIRRYVDMLFGSVLIEARRLFDYGDPQTIYAIPNVVRDILEYNNLRFATLRFALTERTLFEPIDYVIDNSTLTLVLNKAMYDDYCITSSNAPVLFPGGLIPIERYNPLEVPPNMGEINFPAMRCAIACDHVAQHILYDVYGNGKDRPATSGIHAHWTDVEATTLHSIFQIKRVLYEEPVFSSHYTYSSGGGIDTNNNNGYGATGYGEGQLDGTRFNMPMQPSPYGFLPPEFAVNGYRF